MSDDTPFARAVLERLRELREDIIGVGDKVQELHGEVKTTYARESDCVTRVAHEREQTDGSVKRIWEKIEGVGAHLKAVDARVVTLEVAATTEVGADRVKSKFGGWAIGFGTALALAAIGLLLNMVFG